MPSQPTSPVSITTNTATSGAAAGSSSSQPRPTNTAFIILRSDIVLGSSGAGAALGVDCYLDDRVIRSSPVAAHLEALFTRYKIRRERSGVLSTAEVRKKGIFDTFYALQEQHATRVLPSHLRLSMEEREAFKKAFGRRGVAASSSSADDASTAVLEWFEATSKGYALNATEYMRRLEERLVQRRAQEKHAEGGTSSSATPSATPRDGRVGGGRGGGADEAMSVGAFSAPIMEDISGENDEKKATVLLAELCAKAPAEDVLVLNDAVTIHRLPHPDAVSLESVADHSPSQPSSSSSSAFVFVVNGELPLQRSLLAFKKKAHAANSNTTRGGIDATAAATINARLSVEDEEDALKEDVRLVGNPLLWYTVSWRSDDLSWADFNRKVMGSFPSAASLIASEAEAAAKTLSSSPHNDDVPEAVAEAKASLLSKPFCHALVTEGKSYFGLSDSSIRSLKGSVVYSTGPLEAFYSLQTWLSVEAHKTLFGLYAMQRGISLAMLRDLVKNPPIHARGSTAPAFTMTRGVDTDGTLDILQKYAAEEAALPILNTALVFIKPRANNNKVRFLVEKMLADNSIRIIVQGKRTAEAIKEQNIITRHYSVIARNALEVKGRSLIESLGGNSEEARERFAKAFGGEIELNTACEEGKVLSAKEALEGGLKDGQVITAERLDLVWKLCKPVTKLAPGLYMGYSKDDDKYIINGFFPLIVEKFTRPEASVQWYLVSWAEDKLTWADFRGKVIGPTDPIKAPEGSIRDAILAQWRTLDLLGRPDASDNGVHASAGPLEALAERLIWVGGSSGGIEADVLARVAMERGVSTHYSLSSWISNPTVDCSRFLLPNGKMAGEGPIFDLTEDMQTSSFIELLRQAEAEEASRRQRNHALVFIKPHAVTDAVQSVVETMLACHDITIHRRGDTDAETIGERGLVDRHYAVIAQYAMSTAEDLLRPRFITMAEVPKTKQIANGDGTLSEVPLSDEDVQRCTAQMQLEQRNLEEEAATTTAIAILDPLSAAGKKAFEATFGLAWDDAVRCHSVLTAQEALDILDMSPMQLSKKWKNKDLCPKTARLAPGLYVGFFVKENLFIINGFYPLNREKFTTPGRRIRWFAVSWAEERLTWADFRGKVIGPTDPTKAPEGSMRAIIYKEWQQLGLTACPDTSDNGVHASAGALEGLAERTIWLTNASAKIPNSIAAAIEKDPFGRILRSGSMTNNSTNDEQDVSRLQLPTSFIEYCMGNPTFADTNRPIYDVTEDKQSSECANVLRKLYQAASSEFERNRAVILIRPTTASPSVLTAVEKVLAANQVRIDTKETLLPTDFHDRLKSLEPAQIPASAIVLAKLDKDRFHIQFGEQWDEVVGAGRVLTADAAAARLAATFALMSIEDQYKANAKTFDVASRWRQSHLDNNILYLSTGNALVNPSAAAASSSPSTALIEAGSISAKRNATAAIAPSIEVGYDPAHDWYVLNGASCNTTFSSKDGLACCYFVSWAAADLGYASMLGKVIGATDATIAPEDSVRGIIYRQWNQLGLGEAVPANDTGVKCSIGPLQSLFQRCMWRALGGGKATSLSDETQSLASNRRTAAEKPAHPAFRANLSDQLRTDSFGQELLNHGFTPDVIQYILFCNPAIQIALSSSGVQEGPILDLLAHSDASNAVKALLSVKGVLERLWAKEYAAVRAEEQLQQFQRQQNQQGSADGSEPHTPATPSRAPSRAVRAAQGALALRKGAIKGSIRRNGPRNQALVFIKPHAAESEAVTHLVEAKLQEHFIRIDAEGEITSEVIAEKRLIDAHYAAIASYALRANADEIGASTLTDTTRAKFEATFGTSWANASREGRIFNAAAALSEFGLTAKQLSDHFAAATIKMKLAPGLYVAVLPALNKSIVINGFYPLNREKFTTPGRRIRWFAVSWAEERLTWADFRGKVIGPTDPTKAPEGSMRAIIYKEWQQLGLTACPDTSDNGVHASAGPLEGVAERIIWTDATLRQLSFSRALITQRGVTERFLQRCLANPSMSIDVDPIMHCAKASDNTTELKKGALESLVNKAPLTAFSAAQQPHNYNPENIKFGPIFDVLEDMQSSKALDIVQRLFETDRTQNMQNTALVFIKPHAVTPLAVAYVEACFRENNLDIISQGAVMSEEIAARGLIEKHYSTISHCALHWENDVERKAKADACVDEKALAELEKPNPLFERVQQEAGSATGYANKLAEFNTAFGMTLDLALRTGRVMSADAAIRHIAAFEAYHNHKRNRVPMKKYDDRHSEITPAKDLFNRWDKAVTIVKLASGAFAKQISLWEDVESTKATASASTAAVAPPPSEEGAALLAQAAEDPKTVVSLPVQDVHTFVVINGFYPKLAEGYTSVVSGHAVQWYLISWPESKLSWADFRTKFVGPTNPIQAPTGSLRGGLYTNWRDLGLAAKPDTTDNGVHASAGPLEAMVERLIWTTPAQAIAPSGAVVNNEIVLSNPDTISPLLYKDPLGCVLMDHELSADVIARLCANKPITARGSTRPVFVHTEDMQTSALAPFLKEAIAEEEMAQRKAAEEAAREAKRQADLMQIALSNAAAQERTQPLNTAFIFIKPHAVTAAVKDLVEATLQQKGIRIKSQGTFTHNQVARVIDQHYNTVSTFATLKPVHHLVLTDAAKEAFKQLTDGKEDWEQAVSVGHVQNASDAMRELGDLTPSMLARRWEDAPRKIKLAPGVYVAYLPNDDIFVINGFYPRIREKFTAEGSSIHYYVAEWPEEALTWKSFRGDVIGTTDPAKAPEASIRGAIYKHWRNLGLERQPTMADNGVHASAGPVEGLVERCVWLKQLPQLDSFGIEVVTKRGVPVEYFHKWTRNEHVAVSSSVEGAAFDLTEDLQSTEAANMICDAREFAEVTLHPTRKVALMPKRSLYEASLRDFFINLNNMSTVEDFQRLFQYYDRDGTGTISREEFFVDFNRFECYGHPLDSAKVEELFTKYDYNRDGRMNFDEFCILMLERVAHM